MYRLLKIFIDKYPFFLTFVVLSIIFAGCSTGNKLSNNGEYQNKVTDPVRKRIALEAFINGCAAEAKSDYKSAIAEFEKASAIDPNSGGIHYELAKTLYFSQNLPQALKYSQSAVALDSLNIEYLDLLQEIYTTARLSDSAILVLRKMIAIDTNKVGALYSLARLYEINQPGEAINVYKKILSLTGNEWTVLIRISDLYEKLGNLNQAIQSIGDLSTLDPENPGIKKLLAELYLKNKEYSKAVKVLDDILLSYPYDLEARQKKAESFILQENWHAAANEFYDIITLPNIKFAAKIRVASAIFAQSFRDTTLLPVAKKFFNEISRDSLNWEVKMHLGAIAMRENNDSLAMKYFDEVTEATPWNLEAWIRLGGLYFDNRQYHQSIMVMRKASERFPEDFPLNLILGLSYSQLNNFDSSVVYLKKAVRLKYDDVTALSALGFSLNKTGDFAGAIKFLRLAVQIDPKNIELMGTLGLILENNEQYSESDSIYASALLISPNNNLINNNYAYSLSKRKIRLDEALKMVKSAVDAEPYSSSYLDTYGWVFYMMGDYESALKYIQKSLAIDPNNSEVIEHIGDVFYKLGDKTGAIESWKKALELDSKNNGLKLKIQKGIN